MNGENGMKQKGAASHTVANANDGMPLLAGSKKREKKWWKRQHEIMAIVLLVAFRFLTY